MRHAEILRALGLLLARHGARFERLVAAYLRWMELVPNGPQAISITERLFERELGQTARELGFAGRRTHRR